MPFSVPSSQFFLLAMFAFLCALCLAAVLLNWSVAARRPRSPVRRSMQRRLVLRLARWAHGDLSRRMDLSSLK
jgi:hypothetical protein